MKMGREGTASSRLLITARFANRVWDSQKFGRMRAELCDNRALGEEGERGGREGGRGEDVCSTEIA